MEYLYYIGGGAVGGILLTLMSVKIMQMLQLSSYRAKGVISWLRSTRGDYFVRYFAVAFFSTVCMLVFVGCFGSYAYVRYLGLLFYLFNTVLYTVITCRQKSKTPLKCTARILRLSILTTILFAAATGGLLFAGKFLPVRYSLVGLLPLCIIPVVLAAHGLLLPVETLNHYRYEARARKKLRQNARLIKIGITGSYGKTTAKNMLSAMLAKKYNVLATPASYNTPMGITRTVNGMLGEEHEVFIAEMGARYAGDIAKLCKLVQPSVGVLTAVGNQHLATFGSEENVAAAKYELAQGLTPDGVAVFSSDNAGTQAMYDRHTGNKRLAGAQGTDVRYENVSFSARGTEFTLIAGDRKETVHTCLLGRHIPSLVSLCAAVAIDMGVTLSQIAAAMQELPPVEHRLQVRENGDVTVLDDAYNSNEAGSRIALEVLRAFDGAHVVITPGLVELGEEEERANFDLGRAVGESADYAYFVGARANTLQKGATAAGLAQDRIFICASLDDAVRLSGEIAGKKTILFENDLPDNL